MELTHNLYRKALCRIKIYKNCIRIHQKRRRRRIKNMTPEWNQQETQGVMIAHLGTTSTSV